MQIKNPTMRIVRSRRVLYGWERMGGPTGPVEGSLRMIAEEIEILERIAAQRPESAAKIADLVARYGALADTLRQRLN